MNRSLLALFLLTFTACGGSTTTTDCSTMTDTYASYGATFLSSNCRTCHEHTSQFSTQALVQASLTSLEVQISTGQMPEGATLSSTEKAKVLAWLECGAP